ncbi:hypothetical protein PIB30_035172 [Stylosanthes scabra]|uniref:Uncharacterized protein n=1 Tax=Stylosanthes scabra TaxID=79078 RepID=A0ABU6YBM3_9FABA|nr:hypothetical protein [Stylosanthes scabra]
MDYGEADRITYRHFNECQLCYDNHRRTSFSGSPSESFFSGGAALHSSPPSPLRDPASALASRSHHCSPLLPMPQTKSRPPRLLPCARGVTGILLLFILLPDLLGRVLPTCRSGPSTSRYTDDKELYDAVYMAILTLKEG